MIFDIDDICPLNLRNLSVMELLNIYQEANIYEQVIDIKKLF